MHTKTLDHQLQDDGKFNFTMDLCRHHLAYDDIAAALQNYMASKYGTNEGSVAS